ncbi:hypothetical protein BpHYR1_004367 [Brachionus plicatilis]|uniref:Uncharacterized protein n=1 Tax=Brachionus plicatilis TaxID=10195 RepID=A0A3M7Q4B9_BRAPC|nr:hypothetical protein BpHYR1_004367 [Brachionus plicatilis]
MRKLSPLALKLTEPNMDKIITSSFSKTICMSILSSAGCLMLKEHLPQNVLPNTAFFFSATATGAINGMLVARKYNMWLYSHTLVGSCIAMISYGFLSKQQISAASNINQTNKLEEVFEIQKDAFISNESGPNILFRIFSSFRIIKLLHHFVDETVRFQNIYILIRWVGSNFFFDNT